MVWLGGLVGWVWAWQLTRDGGMNLVFEVVIVEGDWFVLGGMRFFFWEGGVCGGIPQ